MLRYARHKEGQLAACVVDTMNNVPNERIDYHKRLWILPGDIDDSVTFSHSVELQAVALSN